RLDAVNDHRGAAALNKEYVVRRRPLADEAIACGKLDPAKVALQTLDFTVGASEQVGYQRRETPAIRTLDLSCDVCKQRALAARQALLDIRLETQARLVDGVEPGSAQRATDDVVAARCDHRKAVAMGRLQQSDEAQRSGGIEPGDAME